MSRAAEDVVAQKHCNTTYEALIRNLALQHLDLLTCELTPIPTYLDTIVYQIRAPTQTFIFKSLDPHTRDPDGIMAEAWVLNHLHEQAIPVPNVLAADDSKHRFPSAYFIMEQACGQPLASLPLTPEEKQPYLHQLGDALRRLHAIHLPGFGWLDEQLYREQHTIRGLYSTWEHTLLHALPASMTYFIAHNLLSSADIEAMERIIDYHRHYLTTVTNGRLLHGDLGPLHVWVNPGSQTLTSIVDFGERMVGDPLWDFVDYDWNDVSAVWSAYAPDIPTSPVFGALFYSYALLRAIPWAHKWHARGATHVLDWLKITLTRADSALET